MLAQRLIYTIVAVYKTNYSEDNNKRVRTMHIIRVFLIVYILYTYHRGENRVNTHTRCVCMSADRRLQTRRSNLNLDEVVFKRNYTRFVLFAGRYIIMVYIQPMVTIL